MDPVDDSNTLPGIRRNLLAGVRDNTLGFWKAARILDTYLANGANVLLNQEAWEAFTTVREPLTSHQEAWEARLLLQLTDSMAPYAKTAGDADQFEVITGNPRLLAEALVWTWTTRRARRVADPIADRVAKVIVPAVKRIDPVLRRHLDHALEAALECKDPWRLKVAGILRKELSWEVLSASYPEENTLNASLMVDPEVGFHLPYAHPRVTTPFGDYLPRLIQAIQAGNLTIEEARSRWGKAARLWDSEILNGYGMFEKLHTGDFLSRVPAKVGTIEDPVRFVRLWLAVTQEATRCIYHRDLQMLVTEEHLNQGLAEWGRVQGEFPAGTRVGGTMNIKEWLEATVPTKNKGEDEVTKDELRQAIREVAEDVAAPPPNKQASAATMILYVAQGLWTPERAVRFWLDEDAKPLERPAYGPRDPKVFNHDFVLAWLRTGEALTDALTVDGHPDPRGLRASLMDFMLPMAGWVHEGTIKKAVAEWDKEIQPKIEAVRAANTITPADPTGSSADKTVSTAVTVTIPGAESVLNRNTLIRARDSEDSAALVYAVRYGNWSMLEAAEWWVERHPYEKIPLERLHHERKDPKVFNLDFARTWFQLTDAITEYIEQQSIGDPSIERRNMVRYFKVPIVKWVDRDIILQAEMEWVESHKDVRARKKALEEIQPIANKHHNQEYLPVILASIGGRGGYGLSWSEAAKIWDNRTNIPASWYQKSAPNGSVPLDASMVFWMLGFASTLDNPKEFLRLDVFSELDLKEGVRNHVRHNWVYAMGPAATSSGVKRWEAIMTAVAKECPDALRWVANNIEGLVAAGYGVSIATNLEKFLPHDPADLVAGPEFAKDFLGTNIDSNEDLYETGAALLLSLHAREITMDVAVAWWRDAVLFSKGKLKLPEGARPKSLTVFPVGLELTGLDLIKRLGAADAALSIEPLKEAMRRWLDPGLIDNAVVAKTYGMPKGKIASFGGPMASGKSSNITGKDDSAASAAERTKATHEIHESAAMIAILHATGHLDAEAAAGAWLAVALTGKTFMVPDGVTPRDPKVFTRGVIDSWVRLGATFQEQGVVPDEWVQNFAWAMQLWVDPDILADVRAERFGPPATGGLTEDQALEAAAVLAVATHAANTSHARQQAVKIWSEPTIPQRQLGELRVRDRGYMVELGRTWLAILKEMPEGWGRTDLFRKSMELTLGSDVVEEVLSTAIGPKRIAPEPLNIKTRGMVAVETLKDDAKEIALRTGVRRIRSLARERLSAWWAKATTPRGATESLDAWEARVRGVEAQHGAFLGTDAGESAMAMLLGFTWTAVSADVDGEQMRAFGDAVARELRVSAGADLVGDFMDEVISPVVRNLRTAPEAAFTTNVRVSTEAVDTEDSDGVTQAEPAARTAHR